MNEKEKIVALAEKHMERAETALESAILLYKNEKTEDCISRAYYAVLHAARAILLLVGGESKSHAGTINTFGLYLVEKGIVEKEYGRILGQLNSLRDRSDYNVMSYLEKQEAENAVKQAKKFIARIKEEINKIE